ncbi:MAG: nucleoside triphosphate pyrophosphohydrolase [Bdellovibrionales bacterium]|nr:nucleoside triphosphate pyrophosphohydrolase [Bdellovibrionales bacterium]
MSKRAEAFEKICWVIERLRDPVDGCPWDREQTHISLKPYLIEEAYEVLEAIDSNPTALCDELGDILLQVLLHSQIADDDNRFSVEDVSETLCSKLVRRHPHVFGTTSVESADEVIRNWDAIKQSEEGKSSSDSYAVSRALPSLLRAFKLGKKARKHNFDWDSPRDVWKKVQEEFAELEEVLFKTDSEKSQETLLEELGDLLFTLAQLSRLLGADPEEVLQRGNDKFEKRFRFMHENASQSVASLKSEEREALWARAKDAVGSGIAKSTRSGK